MGGGFGNFGGNHFNPRPPRGGRLASSSVSPSSCSVFQSTPPARGGDVYPIVIPSIYLISIHAPREGGRRIRGFHSRDIGSFQSTPPARGGDLVVEHGSGLTSGFQSTPPARGGDEKRHKKQSDKDNFNPRPPRGGATATTEIRPTKCSISIHAPREGGRQKVSDFGGF